MSASRNSKQVKHFAHFIRRQNFDKSHLGSTQFNYKYELIGNARNTISALDIYLNYFESPFNKRHHSECSDKNVKYLKEVKQFHISQFFKIFIQIFLLKDCIPLKQNSTSSVTEILNDIFGEKGEKSGEYEPLSLFMRTEIGKYLQTYKEYRQISQKDYLYEKSFQKIDRLLDKLINDFEKKVDSEIDSIKENQFLPKVIKDTVEGKQNSQFLKSMIKHNIQCISCIHVLRKSFKKEVLTQFCEVVKRHMFIKIELLMETRMQEIRNDNALYLPKYSQEVQPIFAKFYDYLRHFPTVKPQLCEDENKKKLLFYQIIKQIVEKCFKYHQDTNNVYPNLSMFDLYIDSKSLMPFISHNSLILDAIGFRGQTKNIELRLATEPTPSFNYEEGYLERQYKIFFLRKYFQPKKKKSSEIMHDESPKDNEFGEMNESKVIQYTFVWRLLNILYEILELKHLTNVKFYEYSESKVFSYRQYLQILEKMYNDLKNGQLKFQDIIPPVDNYYPQKKIPRQSEPFSFKVQNLAQKFNIEFKKDSLLDRYKLQNILQYLTFRSYMAQEIVYIILYQKAFKKLQNIKKYIISYFVNIIQVLHFNTIIRNTSDCDEDFNKELSKQLSKNNFYKELLKKMDSVKIVYEKLNEYKNRNDVNGKFLLRQNPRLDKVIQNIQNCIVQIENLQKDERSIIEHETNQQRQLFRNILEGIYEQDHFIKDDIDNLKRQIDSPSYSIQYLQNQILKILVKTIFVKSKGMMKLVSLNFTTFIAQQIQPYIDQPSRLHNDIDLKLQEPLQKQVFKYINHKLVTIINMYMSSNQRNFRKYQLMYSDSAFDILKQGRRVNQLITNREIEIKIRKVMMYNANIKQEMRMQHHP